MKFNIFEGARRISYLISGIATLITIVSCFNYSPYIHDYLQVPTLNAKALIDPDMSYCPSESSRDDSSKRTSSNTFVNLTFCFWPFVGDDGKKFVPFKEKGNMLYGEPYWSSNLNPYMRDYVSKYQLTPEQDKYYEQIAKDKYWDNWKSSLTTLFMGLAAFWVAVFATGWIVRGFFGIPKGMDKSPS